MQAMFKAKNNTWYPSRWVKGFYFWNHEQREVNTTFPVLFAKLSLLKKTAKNLFGWSGYMASKNYAVKERIK